ncbi:MAG: hypothetical protein LC650_00735 [Actinobacteria bacterium]|nr:hypothetical protein [Actinomycetota bacterium]
MFTTVTTFEDGATGLFDYAEEVFETLAEAMGAAYDYSLAEDVAEVRIDTREGERVLTYTRPSA